MIPALTPQQQGVLVLAMLNKLPHPEDLSERRFLDNRCCPDCCAPCSIIRELERAGMLDEIVKLAPEFMWRDIAWMTDEGVVNKQWLYDCWGCQSNPPCSAQDRAEMSP